MAMTYAEQLKHPNWQRKRLEVLGAADFKCSCCGDSNSMLNVHHKQYIKGRKAWEYEVNELQALCDSCHRKEHENMDLINLIISSSNLEKSDLIFLLSGFCYSGADEYGFLAFAGSRLREAASKPSEAEAIDHVIEALQKRKAAIAMEAVQNGKN